MTPQPRYVWEFSRRNNPLYTHTGSELSSIILPLGDQFAFAAMHDPEYATLSLVKSTGSKRERIYVFGGKLVSDSFPSGDVPERFKKQLDRMNNWIENKKNKLGENK